MFKNMGGNIPGGNFLGGNFPGGSLMGGNFPVGSFPDTIEDNGTLTDFLFFNVNFEWLASNCSFANQY